MLVDQFKELLDEAIARNEAKLVDNSTIAARMDDDDPPTQAAGMKPAGEYEHQTSYDMADSKVMPDLREGLGEAADIPEIRKQFQANFADLGKEDEPSADNTNDVTPTTPGIEP